MESPERGYAQHMNTLEAKRGPGSHFCGFLSDRKLLLPLVPKPLLRRLLLRPAALARLAPLAHHRLDLGARAVVAQRLILIERQSQIGERRVRQGDTGEVSVSFQALARLGPRARYRG